MIDERRLIDDTGGITLGVGQPSELFFMRTLRR